MEVKEEEIISSRQEYYRLQLETLRRQRSIFQKKQTLVKSQKESSENQITLSSLDREYQALNTQLERRIIALCEFDATELAPVVQNYHKRQLTSQRECEGPSFGSTLNDRSAFESFRGLFSFTRRTRRITFDESDTLR
ncbi:hypothetical protein PROFUN_13600 [Planoprotostelium fungivorum]|uniref:Uncharacterized protein n=1 Tax=Planoprotostelium fungivorum TaxID=1890364 RepID=A0A2P6N3N4_9EUKA|nr:hypothetical protein PROFUN_13600 [Planoprotostelium fungivorum]